MAYDPNNLSVLSYANGHSQWHYRTEDSAATVGGVGYLDAAASMMRIGDVMFVNASVGSAIETGLFAVRANDQGKVTLTDFTRIGD